MENTPGRDNRQFYGFLAIVGIIAVGYSMYTSPKWWLSPDIYGRLLGTAPQRSDELPPVQRLQRSTQEEQEEINVAKARAWLEAGGPGVMIRNEPMACPDEADYEPLKKLRQIMSRLRS